MYTDILLALVKIINPLTELPVRIGPLTQEACVAIQPAAGGAESTCMDFSTLDTLSLALAVKAVTLKQAIQTLDTIHQTLTRMYPLPTGDGWTVYAAQTIGPPASIGQEENGLWLAASSLMLKVYNKECRKV